MSDIAVVGVRSLSETCSYIVSDGLLFCAMYYEKCNFYCIVIFFFFQAEDGIRDLVRSRGLGDVYKRQL